MSRTDKDLPYWFADEYREVHHWRCLVGRAECSLPTFKGSYNRRFTSCYWQPVHEPWRSRWFTWQPTPPKWYVDHVWNNAQRVSVRDRARRAISEYRASHNVETELPKQQHRHCAQWMWW
jgi:hypothetical protein